MRLNTSYVALGLLLLGGSSASAQILQGVMAINGAEMPGGGGTARDAVARQVDVEQNSVKLTCEAEEGKYRPGKITFRARPGRSINLGKIQEAIVATRLSGNTNMRVEYLEIGVRGNLTLRNKEPVLQVSSAEQEFELEADDRILEKQLLQAAGQSEEAVTVVGRVDGWYGRFPVVLRTLAKRYGTKGKKPILLVITSLETVKNEGKKQALAELDGEVRLDVFMTWLTGAGLYRISNGSERGQLIAQAVGRHAIRRSTTDGIAIKGDNASGIGPLQQSASSSWCFSAHAFLAH